MLRLLPLLVVWIVAAGLARAEDRGLALMALPMVTYDSNLGIGYGAMGRVVQPVERGEDPYRARVDLQLYRTTRGYDDHFLAWDLPRAFGGDLRWDVQIRFQRWTRAPYYGTGNLTPLRERAPDRFYQWRSTRPFVLTHIRVPLEGPMEVYVGMRWQHVWVGTYRNSLLSTERPTGFKGGRMTSATLGLYRDTRTNEVDPTDGTAMDLAVRTALPAPVSQTSFAGVHASVKGWARPGGPIVLAGHLVVDANAGDQGFFDEAYFGGLQRTAIGGRSFLRGHREERLRADGLAGGQGEARFRVGETSVHRRLDIRWALAGFTDVAWLWTWQDPSGSGGAPHVTAGSGLRLTFNDHLVARLDGALGLERYEQSPYRRPQAQIYLLADQPF